MQAEISALPSAAQVEGPPIVLSDDATAGLAACLHERALRYRATTYVEIDRHGDKQASTVAELLGRAHRLAVELEHRVPDHDAVVVIVVESALDYVPAAWGCIFAGTTFLPWHYREASTREGQTRSKLEFIARSVGSPVLITTRAVNDQLDLAGSGVFSDLILLDDDAQPSPTTAPGAPGEFHFSGALDGQAAVLTQTSGSSGTPKLAAISFSSLLHRWQERRMEFGDDLHLSTYPLDIAFSQITQLFVNPRGGIYLDLERAFGEPASVLRVLDEYRVPQLSSLNSLLAKILQEIEDCPPDGNLASLRRVEFSAEMISQPVAVRLRRLLEAFGAGDLRMQFVYASTELGTMSASTNHDAATASTACVGPPLAGVALRIVDDDGHVVSQGEIGRLQARSELCRFGRYYGDAAATENAFTADGWFRTGDLGFIDDDGLTIVGRETGMIIANGRNLSLGSIDAHLSDIAGVAGGCIASAPARRSTAHTEELAVFFVPVDSSESSLSSTAAMIRNRIAANCGIAAKHVVPLAEADFPRTRTGKVDRPELISGFERGRWQALSIELVPDSAVPPSGRSAAEAWITDRWRHVLALDSDRPSAGGFFDLGGDSLKFAELIVAIEGEFGCEIPIQRFFQHPTLSNLVNLLEERRSGGGGAARGERPAVSTAHVIRGLESALATWNGERAFAESLIVGANTAGSRTPIVWAFQSEHEFTTLANALGSDQPLYGMRSLDQLIELQHLTTDTLEAVSLRYVTETLGLRLPLPLVVGGNCSGAVVALGVARKLRQLGEAPAPLVLLNWMFSFGRYDDDVLLVQGMDGADHFALHNEAGEEIRWEHDFPQAQTRTIAAGHGRYFHGPGLDDLVAVLLEQSNGSTSANSSWFSRSHAGLQRLLSKLRTG